MVFQDARLLPWKRVLGNVVLGLTGSGARERGRTPLAEVGLAGREDAWPADLSGGEQQRVSLARSLVREPQLLLADEPFGALDALTRIRMHALLRRLCEAHRPAVLLVTHDVDEAIALADRVVVLDAGRIAADVRVKLPAPRGQGSPEYAALRGRLLRQLGVDLDGDEQAGAEPDRHRGVHAQDAGALGGPGGGVTVSAVTAGLVTAAPVATGPAGGDATADARASVGPVAAAPVRDTDTDADANAGADAHAAVVGARATEASPA